MKLDITVTGKNLEAAFAGESMAYMKYTYFARLARSMGDEITAAAFEATAAQEVHHALGHLDLLYPASMLTPSRMLEIAIAGETYEYTEMYPRFREQAAADQAPSAMAEFSAQAEESREHAESFQATLAKAEKRFAAVAKVEQRHAAHYQSRHDALASEGR